MSETVIFEGRGSFRGQMFYAFVTPMLEIIRR